MRYRKNFALPFVGFDTELEAKNSFKLFQTSGRLPPGIFSPASLCLLDDLPVPLQPQTPKHCNRPLTSPSSCNISPSPSPHCAQVLPGASLSPIQHNMISSTQTHQPSRLANTSSLSLLASTEENLSFYVVIEGPTPGIYGSE